jgi:hypothetical protein
LQTSLTGTWCIYDGKYHLCLYKAPYSLQLSQFDRARNIYVLNYRICRFAIN